MFKLIIIIIINTVVRTKFIYLQKVIKKKLQIYMAQLNSTNKTELQAKVVKRGKAII